MGRPQEQVIDEYIVSWYRWVILVTYTLTLTASSYTMMTFAPISTIVANVYEIDTTIVNSCVVVFLISFILFNFVSVWALENYGLSPTVSLNYFNHVFSVQVLRCRPNCWSVAKMGSAGVNRLFRIYTYSPGTDCKFPTILL